jgi:GNAT superfamily N-acetyltransferase
MSIAGCGNLLNFGTMDAQQVVLEFLKMLTPEDILRLEDFDCGDPEYNEFLKRSALAQQDNRLNRTYLIRSDPCPGFVTVSAAQVTRDMSGLSTDELPYPLAPALLIGRLAVDQRYAHRGLGRQLVRAARVMGTLLPVGCRFLALHVDIDNSAAIRLYESEGFWVPGRYKPRGRLLLMLYDLARQEEPHNR